MWSVAPESAIMTEDSLAWEAATWEDEPIQTEFAPTVELDEEAVG